MLVSLTLLLKFVCRSFCFSLIPTSKDAWPTFLCLFFFFLNQEKRNSLASRVTVSMKFHSLCSKVFYQLPSSQRSVYISFEVLFISCLHFMLCTADICLHRKFHDMTFICMVKLPWVSAVIVLLRQTETTHYHYQHTNTTHTHTYISRYAFAMLILCNYIEKHWNTFIIQLILDLPQHFLLPALIN